MNSKLKNLIKGIILGTTAALTPTNAHTTTNENTPITIKRLNDISYEINATDDIIYPKLVLERTNSPISENNFFHRSHRSHSSHRSHYSSSSGYSKPKEQPKRNSETNTQKNYLSDDNSNNKKNNFNELIFEFGSRVLRKGMKGTDVAELEDILSGLGYKEFKKDGYFDDDLEKSVKSFQKEKEIEANGEVDVMTFYYLKKNKK